MDTNSNAQMKKLLPFLVSGLGLIFIVLSQVLRAGTADADAAITNLAGVFVLLAGAVCLVGGVATFLLRHDSEVW